MDIGFEHKIRQRAYEIWIAAGRREGDAEHHWLHAETIIRNEAEVPTAAAMPAVRSMPAKTKSKSAKKAAASPVDATAGTAIKTAAKTLKSKTVAHTTGATRRSKVAGAEANA